MPEPGDPDSDDFRPQIEWARQSFGGQSHRLPAGIHHVTAAAGSGPLDIQSHGLEQLLLGPGVEDRLVMAIRV
jgi:hypothetical protein